MHRPAVRPALCLPRARAALACAAASFFTAAPLPAAELSAAAAAQAAQASYPEYLALLSMPNDAIVPADIRRNVDWLEGAFRSRGFVTRQLANDGKPMLFAEWPAPDPQRRTVLFYMHLDGQPVVESEWAQRSPWSPVLKRRSTQGEWEAIDSARLLSGPVDPEWRVFARSAADDKAPIMIFLAAIDALKKAGATPAVNVKVILDSEEEKGSPTIGKVMKAHLALLQCDAIVIHDGPMHASNRPTLVFGNRGVAKARLTVYGPRVALHSGYYGNYAPNPAQRLAALLASMKDAEGRVTVPGYYDHVAISDADRQVMAGVPDDEVALRRRIGIARAEQVGANYQESMQYPSLNVRGMAAGAIGDKVANVVPERAIAELDLRTTPDSGPAFLAERLEAHIRAQGWHLVKGEPSDDERRHHDRLASFSYQAEGGEAAGSPIDSAVGRGRTGHWPAPSAPGPPSRCASA